MEWVITRRDDSGRAVIRLAADFQEAPREISAHMTGDLHHLKGLPSHVKPLAGAIVSMEAHLSLRDRSLFSVSDFRVRGAGFLHRFRAGTICPTVP